MASLLELIAQKKAALTNHQKTAKPKEGRSRWRILPSWRAEGGQFWHDFGQHFIKDASNTIKVVYVCTDKTYGRPCEVCSSIAAAIRVTADPEMEKLLSDAAASGRILVNALNIDGDTPNDPQILELAPGVFNKFLSIVSEWGEEILDLNAGKDVVIERTGKGKLTKYDVQVAAKSQPVSPDVMKKVVNLDEYVAQESEEQMRRAIANLQAVAGALPAPAAGRKPSIADLSVEDVDGTLAIPGESASAASTKPAAPRTEPAVSDVPPTSTGDADLDNLLAELG